MSLTNMIYRAALPLVCFIYLLVNGENGCKKLVYLPCIKNKNFTGHVIKTFRLMVPGLVKCQTKCFNEKYCVSFNLGPVTHQTLTCELNDLDHVAHPNDVITQEGARYCPIKNPCSSNPCPGVQHCSPDFYNEKYVCSDGAWSEWGIWSQCITHGTTISRTRVCRSPAGEQKSDCPGKKTDKKTVTPTLSCLYYLRNGRNTSGVYTSDDNIKVFCDQKTDGGGWTVIQRRQDGSQDFELGWQDYKVGFGNLTGEFWLGLDKMHKLTSGYCKYRLRVDLEDTVYAEYDYFKVGDEADNYKLKLGKYSGTAGDSLTYHDGAAFSAKDKGPKTDCASKHKGAWWHKTCYYSNLNGRYLNGSTNAFAQGIHWLTWRGYYFSIKKVEMKMRPVN